MGKSFMGKFKIVCSLLLCCLLAVSAVACGRKGDDDGTTTVIRIATNGSNTDYGSDIMEAQAERFNALHAEDSYAEGKKGVKVEIIPEGSDGTIDQGTISAAYDILYTGSGYTSVDSAAKSQWISNIDDIVKAKIPGEDKTIEDKIDSSIRWNYKVEQATNKAAKGYYAIPAYEAYGGLTYDKDLFDEGYYFARTGGTAFHSAILNKSYNFVGANGTKSVGPDGVEGTEDDGLPSSLYELIALCEKIKSAGISPFAITSDPNFYINYFIEALYVSLLGYENGKSLKDCNSTGIDVVVGYGSENLFPGELSGLKKPITERIAIDDSCGYYMSWTVEKYYTFAFLQLMEQKSWFNTVGKAKTAQYQFLQRIDNNSFGGAMLVENSYWVNGSRIRGNFADYEKYDKGQGGAHQTRQFRWMSLPVNIVTTVDGSNNAGELVPGTTTNLKESKKGEAATLYIPDGSYFCVNYKYHDNEEHLAAIKDWFQFMYSDAELSYLTAQTNYGYMVKYSVKESDVNNAPAFTKSYTQSFVNLLNSANKVYPYGSSAVYKKNPGNFSKAGGAASYLFGGGSSNTINVRSYLVNTTTTEGAADAVKVCFQEKMIPLATWDTYNIDVPASTRNDHSSNPITKWWS
jgi:hypothetical protein